MNEKTVNEQYSHICFLVKHKRLKEALGQLESFMWQCNRYDLQTRMEQLQMSYHYMLQYMRDGVNDPDRKKLHNKLLTDTLEITDQVRLSILDDVSNDLYQKCRRQYNVESTIIPIQKLQSRLESFQNDLAIGHLISKEKKEEV